MPPEATATPPDAVLTVDDLAALLRVNRKTVYDAFQRGELPGGRRVGRTIRFARSVILDWLAEGDAGPARGRPSPRPARAPAASRRKAAR